MVSVTTGVMTGMANKINFFSKLQNRGVATIVYMENYGKTGKLIKQVCENNISDLGVSYV